MLVYIILNVLRILFTILLYLRKYENTSILIYIIIMRLMSDVISVKTVQNLIIVRSKIKR